MKKTMIAVALAALALTAVNANAANNPEDWRVSYASVMSHYNAGRLSQAYAELPRLGLSGAQLDAAWNAIKSGTTWSNMGDFDKWLGGNVNQNPGNGNGTAGNGNGNGQFVTHTDFQTDQQRQDAALNAERDRAWKEEQKQWNEIQTKYTEAAGKALEGEVRNNKADQAKRDAGQDEHINAVQGAAQTANDRATALEGRADGTEAAIRETNAQLEVTDGRSIDNAKRLDGVEQVNSKQDGQIAGNKAAIEQEAKDRTAGDAQTLKSATGYTDGKVAAEAQARADGDAKTLKEANGYTDGAVKAQANIQKGVDAKQDVAIADNASAVKKETAVRSEQFTQLSAGVQQAQATGEYAHARIDVANANIEANRQALVNTNKRVAQNSADIANHEQRLTSLEQQTNKGFSDLKRQIDDNKKDANAGIAGVAAIASIPQVTDKQDFSVGAGVGARGSEQAIAVGFSGRISDSVVTKFAVSSDTQNGWTMGAGVAVGW